MYTYTMDIGENF